MVAITKTQTSITAADLRASLVSQNFTLRKERHEDLRESQFSIRHPQDERVELVVVINVNNVFYKDGEYDGVTIFTLVKDAPLNIPGHPLNIVVGLPQLHDATLFHNIVEGISARFRSLPVDDEVLRWYRF